MGQSSSTNRNNNNKQKKKEELKTRYKGFNETLIYNNNSLPIAIATPTITIDSVFESTLSKFEKLNFASNLIQKVKEELVLKYNNFKEIKTIDDYLRSTQYCYIENFDTLEILWPHQDRWATLVRWPFDSKCKHYITDIDRIMPSSIEEYKTQYDKSNLKLEFDRHKAIILLRLCMIKWIQYYSHKHERLRLTRQLYSLMKAQHWEMALFLFNQVYEHKEQTREGYVVEREGEGEGEGEGEISFTKIIMEYSSTVKIDITNSNQPISICGYLVKQYVLNRNTINNKQEETKTMDKLLIKILNMLTKSQINELFDNKDNMFMTYLKHSSESSVNIEIVQLFISCGIDLTHRNESAQTILSISMNNNMLSTTQIIIDTLQKNNIPLTSVL
jgi:hypothetical protein